MVLRGARFVFAVVLLGFSQKLSQAGDVQVAESPTGKPCRDLLEQPAVAVRIAERRICAVGAIVRVVARYGRSAERFEMECVADLGAAGRELGSCRLDVRDHEIQILH